VVIGDLRPGFGQGLVWGRAVGRRASPVWTVLRDSERLGYRSSAENAALRGVSARYQRGAWCLSALAGYDRRDARIGADGTVRSMPESGVHIGTTARQGKDLLGLKALGLRLRYGTSARYGGISIQGLALGTPVDLRRSTKPWAFYGRQQVLVAGDLRWALRRLDLFGAWAYDAQGPWAGVGGVRWRLGKTRLGVSARRFGPGYYSLFGAAFSATGMKNEQGILVTAQSAWGRLTWRAFLDRYGRLATSPTQPLTRVRTIYGIEVKRSRRARLRLAGRFQREVFKRRRGGEPVNERGYRGRAEAIYAADATQLKGRLEIRRTKTQGDQTATGRLLSVRLKRRQAWLNGVLHMSRFVIPTYAARIYEFEAEIPGAVSIPPLYGTGWRFYALSNIQWKERQFSLRYRWEKTIRQTAEHQLCLQIDWRH
jgi:hypothetical protein